MAEEVQKSATPRRENDRETFGLLCGFAGWLLPGLGHALQKMWGRAIVFFVTVGVLVLTGAGMRGNVFNAEGGDAFRRARLPADLGTGTFIWWRNTWSLMVPMFRALVAITERGSSQPPES